MSRIQARFLIAALALGLLGACNDPQFHASNARHWVPLTPELLTAMQEKGMHKEDPILIRTYKQEAEFEVWKKDVSGRYALLKTFPMCRWSGQLGPKRKEGDRQAPEGYYPITPAQMNPNSNYHLSYDMGYPNAYDRAHGGTGAYLMVHGDCSSAGCYSMTDQQIEEIYALVREAHSGGQKAVQMEALPFRFTPANLARHRLDPNMPFWRELKQGADRFEITKQEPKVGVCNGHYTFDRATRAGEAAGCGADSDPELAKQVAAKAAEDNALVAELVSKGTPAVKLAYDDGGQNPSFRFKTLETSRPEAIAEGPNVELLDPKGALTKVAVRAHGFDEEFDRGRHQGCGFAEHGLHLGRDIDADDGAGPAEAGCCDRCFGGERRRSREDRERNGLDGRYGDHGELQPSEWRFGRFRDEMRRPRAARIRRWRPSPRPRPRPHRVRISPSISGFSRSCLCQARMGRKIRAPRQPIRKRRSIRRHPCRRCGRRRFRGTRPRAARLRRRRASGRGLMFSPRARSSPSCRISRRASRSSPIKASPTTATGPAAGDP